MRKNWFFIALTGAFVLSGAAHYMRWGAILEFAFSSVAILFVAGFLGKATESVAHYAGQRLGGFLNATFGNAAELIIAIFLVKEGLFDMVKASLTGAIIGNLLLVLGLSILLGGLKYKEQHYNIHLAGYNATLMMLAVIGLFVPAIFVKVENFSFEQDRLLSLTVAGILIIAYILWLIFSMITHKDTLAESEATSAGHGEQPAWSKKTSILFLVLATVMVALVSEWLVGTLETFTTRFGLSELFVGAFVIAIVGNAAEHSAAVMLAMKNKIGAAVEIAIGSSLQIALFVAPVLVFVSMLFGNTMDIVFTTIELAAIGVSVFIATSISRDGRTNWYEGALLLMVYIILGFAFYLV
ncbi:cation transporter [Paenibacillus darwinianus]|uniref:Ca(2+)/H(+) antiporter n=1 Tax=Paenibacillus darwinianus TaxID=1380763 RepID=A0A9W5W7D3_9BACL|nr:calcium/proton exchanger [Paenibacillus darwinianus]EXX88082.1 cation transporter [Paenibacillus darwinianus]EXX88378.1 cation transporter [Paenibacillus darwinianus]EXX89934.1 cation transporter [Paenibacillus darwinianus]